MRTHIVRTIVLVAAAALSVAFYAEDYRRHREICRPEIVFPNGTPGSAMQSGKMICWIPR